MADLVSVGRGDAETFMISAGLVFEVVAAFCSSPQTAELNAHARSATLMKWVGLGLGVSAIYVAIAAFILGGGMPAVAGGALAGVILAVAYRYANACGLASDQPGTENYNG